MNIFRPPSRSGYVSYRVKSVLSKQQIQHAHRPIAGPRRKPRVLPRAHTRPELPARIRNHQVPLRDRIYPEPSTRTLKLGRSYSASWRPQPLTLRPSAKTDASTLVTADQQDHRDSRIQLCCKVIPTFKIL